MKMCDMQMDGVETGERLSKYDRPAELGEMIYRNEDLSRDLVKEKRSLLPFFFVMVFGVLLVSHMIIISRAFFLIIFLLGFSLYSFAAAVSYKAVINLELYENGLLLTWRTAQQVLKGQLYYVMYKDIRAIYLNSENIRYVTIEFRLRKKWIGKKFGIMKYQIDDINAFKEFMRKKVPVIENKDLKLSKNDIAN